MKEMLFLFHKNWEWNSVNRFVGALKASNWFFIVVGVLMTTTLWILEEYEDNIVKYAFSKKKKKSDGIFVNKFNFWGERGKSKFQKKNMR